jgi:hypothetical protein
MAVCVINILHDLHIKVRFVSLVNGHQGQLSVQHHKKCIWKVCVSNWSAYLHSCLIGKGTSNNKHILRFLTETPVCKLIHSWKFLIVGCDTMWFF